MFRTLTLCFLALILTGCAQPMSQKNVPMAIYDKHTEYNVSENQDGFGITVFYSRYQFIPESDAVATACKSVLTSIAYDEAKKRGKDIKPINEQRITISMGRNGLTGITSCQSTGIVDYK
jgi:hypothetical protein